MEYADKLAKATAWANKLTLLGDSVTIGSDNEKRNTILWNWNTRATSVVIPGFIDIVGSYAFCESMSIRSTDIKEGVRELKSNSISPDVIDISIPSTVKRLNTMMFNNSNLETIKFNGDIVIDSLSLQGLTELNDIVNSENIIEIETNGIIGCETIKYIDLRNTKLHERAIVQCKIDRLEVGKNTLDIDYDGMIFNQSVWTDEVFPDTTIKRYIIDCTSEELEINNIEYAKYIAEGVIGNKDNIDSKYAKFSRLLEGCEEIESIEIKYNNKISNNVESFILNVCNK